VYYTQECPTCGRSLNIRVAYIGRRVICQHCRGHFLACDPDSPQYPPHDSGIDLLRRADELLELADQVTEFRQLAHEQQRPSR
jgi:hypothetical protein